LLETKTPDKQTTLLHFLVETVEEKFPDLANFYDDLDGITAASRVPMEALTSDVQAVVSGMTEADKELIATGPGAPQRLVNFIREQSPRVSELQTKAETARNIFAQTTEWFGEALNKPSPETFFTCVVKFIQQFKKVQTELEKRRLAEQAMAMRKQSESSLYNGKTSSYGVPGTNVNATPSRQRKSKDRALAQEARLAKRRIQNRTRQINGDGMMDEILAGMPFTSWVETSPGRSPSSKKSLQQHKLKQQQLYRLLTAIPCEATPVVGEWCEWQEWGPCEYTTCTRKRRRACACPKPENFSAGACPTVLPQDDIRVGNTYLKSEGEEKCAVGTDATLVTCLPQKDSMEERDIGACDGWKIAQGWAQIMRLINDLGVVPWGRPRNRSSNSASSFISQTKPLCLATLTTDCTPMVELMTSDFVDEHVNLCTTSARAFCSTKVPEKYVTVIGVLSELGKQCYNPKLYSHGAGSLKHCVEKYYFSRSGQRNTYSNLNNLAFSLENCKFTCAINPDCEAIEFSEGYFCKLFSKFNSDDLKREIGTVLLTKPSNCIFHLNKKQRANYPFRDAVKDISSVYNKAQLVAF
ncbi:hypothetical protein ACTXT7_014678, partial [Hymenolepis weldensis]